LICRISEYLVDRIKQTPNIGLSRRMAMTLLRVVTLKNCDTGEERTIETFFCLGGVPGE
jgi:hypothetical protein